MLLSVKQGEPRSVRPVRRHGESRREPGAFVDDTEPETAVSDGRGSCTSKVTRYLTLFDQLNVAPGGSHAWDENVLIRLSHTRARRELLEANIS